MRETTSETYCIEFEPVEVGSHLVEVYFNGVMLKNFPYVIKVYDTSKIKVDRPDRAMMDESIKLQSKQWRKYKTHVSKFFCVLQILRKELLIFLKFACAVFQFSIYTISENFSACFIFCDDKFQKIDHHEKTG